MTACPILYGDSPRIGDKGVSRHKGEELGVGGGGGAPTRLCQLPEDRGPAEPVLSFTPADLFELQWAVRCHPV